jgi:large subunit ribosomal protein L10
VTDSSSPPARGLFRDMNKEQKQATIDEIAAQIKEAEAVFAVDYRGISVPQAAELRQRLNDAGATFRVVKNSLTERAADKAGADALKELLEGPTAFTFVRADGDAALAAKALAQFRRQTDALAFKGGSMGGEALSIDEIESISRLPARDVLQAQFVGVLASPVTGLVRGLASLISGLAVALKQIEEQGLVGGEAPPEEPPPEEEAPEEEEAPAEEAPAEDEETVTESEAPGDPVAEAEAVEEQADETKET